MTAIVAWCFIITTTIIISIAVIWRVEKNEESQQVLSIKWKRVVGALITFPFPQLTPPITHEEEKERTPSRSSPERSHRAHADIRSVIHRLPHTQKHNTHTVHTLVSKKPHKATELLGITEEVNFTGAEEKINKKLDFEPEGFFAKKIIVAYDHTACGGCQVFLSSC